MSELQDHWIYAVSSKSAGQKIPKYRYIYFTIAWIVTNSRIDDAYFLLFETLDKCI